MKTQKTLTIGGKRITPGKLRKSNPAEAKGGHNISTIDGLEIHWLEWIADDQIHILNAGSIHTNAAFGAKVYFLKA